MTIQCMFRYRGTYFKNIIKTAACFIATACAGVTAVDQASAAPPSTSVKYHLASASFIGTGMKGTTLPFRVDYRLGVLHVYFTYYSPTRVVDNEATFLKVYRLLLNPLNVPQDYNGVFQRDALENFYNVMGDAYKNSPIARRLMDSVALTTDGQPAGKFRINYVRDHASVVGSLVNGFRVVELDTTMMKAGRAVSNNFDNPRGVLSVILHEAVHILVTQYLATVNPATRAQEIQNHQGSSMAEEAGATVVAGAATREASGLPVNYQAVKGQFVSPNFLGRKKFGFAGYIDVRDNPQWGGRPLSFQNGGTCSQCGSVSNVYFVEQGLRRGRLLGTSGITNINTIWGTDSSTGNTTFRGDYLNTFSIPDSLRSEVFAWQTNPAIPEAQQVRPDLYFVPAGRTAAEYEGLFPLYLYDISRLYPSRESGFGTAR